MPPNLKSVRACPSDFPAFAATDLIQKRLIYRFPNVVKNAGFMSMSNLGQFREKSGFLKKGLGLVKF